MSHEQPPMPRDRDEEHEGQDADRAADAYIAFVRDHASTREAADRVAQVYDRRGTPFAIYLGFEDIDPYADDAEEVFRSSYIGCYTERDDLVADTISAFGWDRDLDRVLSGDPLLRAMVRFDHQRFGTSSVSTSTSSNAAARSTSSSRHHDRPTRTPTTSARQGPIRPTRCPSRARPANCRHSAGRAAVRPPAAGQAGRSGCPAAHGLTPVPAGRPAIRTGLSPRRERQCLTPPTRHPAPGHSHQPSTKGGNHAQPTRTTTRTRPGGTR